MTQNAIDNFDVIRKDVDSASIATTVIRKKINDAAYTKIHAQSGENKSLTYAQTAAQLDAIKRFVDTMETEAVQ